MKKSSAIIAFVAASAFTLGAQETKQYEDILTRIENSGDFAPMFSFQPTHDAPDNITNVKTWQGVSKQPAGAKGFIRAEGNQFIDGEGKTIRFIGTNICFSGCFPSHEDADRVAAELARYGINVVRLHYVHHSFPKNKIYPEPDSFIEPKQLERFDYFFAKLKENGIYTYFQLNIARKFGAQNGLENADRLPHYNKGVDNFDVRMIELQKRFHSDILNHLNTYTGLRYKDEPAISMMELANENSIVWAWFSARHKIPDIVEPYRSELMNRWNDFLNAKYGDCDELKNSWPGKNEWDSEPQRALDFTEFLSNVESTYFSDLRTTVKEEIKAPQPVTGTQLHYGFDLPQSEMDYCDFHMYWNHPTFRGLWNAEKWYTKQKALVNGDGFPGSNLCMASRSRILGKPFTMSEFDHVNLNPYAAEGDVMASALGAFQNWSAIIQFAWTHSTDFFPVMENPMFTMCSSTQKLVHFPACWSMFVRGDVTPGDTDMMFIMDATVQDEISAIARSRNTGSPAWLQDKMMASLPLALPSGRRIPENPALFDEPGRKVIRNQEDIPQELKDAYSNKEIVSSTGEITWNWQEENAGYFKVDTHGTKAFSGFVRGRSFSFTGMVLTPGKTRLDWLTLTLTNTTPSTAKTSTESRIAPGKYLLAVTGLVHNADARIMDVGGEEITFAEAYGGAKGHGPVLCEGIDAVLSFNSLGGKLKCTVLDPNGNPKGKVPVKKDRNGNAVLHIGPEYQTVWYELTVK